MEKKDTSNIQKRNLPNIEHIVLSGAGHGIYSYIGAFSILLKQCLNQIQSYTTV